MAYKIDTATARKKLVPRREPYWHKLTRGRYLGFRRTATGGSWFARLQDEASKKSDQSFGESLDFEEAVSQALNWFTHASHVEDKHYRVRDTIADYVSHLKINNGPKSARDTELRLKKHVPASILGTELTKLTTVQLKRWHQSLVKLNGDEEDTRKSKHGANKLLTKLRAALNLAFRSGLGRRRRVRCF